MPKELESIREKVLENIKKQYPEKDEKEQKSLSYAIATKIYSDRKAKLKAK